MKKKIKRLIKKIKDLPLAWMESIGSKMNVYAWGKRWGDRKKGTGYKNDKRKRNNEYPKGNKNKT